MKIKHFYLILSLLLSGSIAGCFVPNTTIDQLNKISGIRFYNTVPGTTASDVYVLFNAGTYNDYKIPTIVYRAFLSSGTATIVGQTSAGDYTTTANLTPTKMIYGTAFATAANTSSIFPNGYVTVNSDDKTIDFYDANVSNITLAATAATPVITTKITGLGQNTLRSVFLVGSMTKEVVVFNDDILAGSNADQGLSSSGTARIRFINCGLTASVGAGALGITVRDSATNSVVSTIDFATTAYKASSGYKSIAAVDVVVKSTSGAYNFAITGQTATTATVANIRLLGKKSYTLVAYGNTDNTTNPITLKLLTDK